MTNMDLFAGERRISLVLLIFEVQIADFAEGLRSAIPFCRSLLSVLSMGQNVGVTLAIWHRP